MIELGKDDEMRNMCSLWCINLKVHMTLLCKGEKDALQNNRLLIHFIENFIVSHFDVTFVANYHTQIVISFAKVVFFLSFNFKPPVDPSCEKDM